MVGFEESKTTVASEWPAASRMVVTTSFIEKACRYPDVHWITDSMFFKEEKATSHKVGHVEEVTLFVTSSPNHVGVFSAERPTNRARV